MVFISKVSEQAIYLKGPRADSNPMALRKKERNKEGPERRMTRSWGRVMTLINVREDGARCKNTSKGTVRQ